MERNKEELTERSKKLTYLKFYKKKRALTRI